jgi:alpha-mannosidase
MLPEGNYVSGLRPQSIAKIEKEFKDKGRSDWALCMFGVGDGGGGPAPEHLERAERMKNLAGIAPVVQMRAVDFFDRIAEKTGKLATYADELYMERHQGCLTSQAKCKLYNRRMEIALRELEFALAAGRILCGYDPAAETAEAAGLWEDVLLFQFHDILPGSSYARVYDEAYERYREMLARTESMTAEAYARLAAAADSKGAADPYFVANSLSWDREALLDLGGREVRAVIPASGYKIVDAASAKPAPAGELACGPCWIENGKLKVTFDPDGTIRSILDKRLGREAVPEGARANRLVVFQDEGDAWDFDISYHDMPEEPLRLVSAKPEIRGARAVMRCEYAYGRSTFVQEVLLEAGGDLVEFDTRADWQERAKMLRMISEFDAFASEAVCDIQFGSIRRPLHDNTLNDFAKYEVCAHKWIDISSRDHGVALLNDCKYGHKAKGRTIELTLLRSTQDPGKDADIGEHRFRYAIYPHAGDECAAGVARKGYEFNVAPHVRKISPAAGPLPAAKSLLDIANENIIVETVKRSEDGKGIVFRLYERFGANCDAVLKADFAAKAARTTDLLENETAPLKLEDGRFEIRFGPFEIVTVKFDLE